MNIVRVIVPGPFYDAFDYLLPADWSPPLLASRVWLEFNRKEQVGIVVGFADESHVPAAKLKWLLRPIDTVPLFNAAQRHFISWLADYYQAPLGDMYHLALPALLREGAPANRQVVKVMALTPEARRLIIDDFSRSPQQALVWQQLQATALSRSQLLAQGAKASALKAMIDKGWLSVTEQPLPRLPLSIAPSLSANAAQQAVIDWAGQCLDRYQAIALFGVTGSGKTEVYLQMLAKVLSHGRQALVLVPEIGLTPQTVLRFKTRFGGGVVALHSALNDRERLEAWLAVQAGDARVVIGTRSALWVPFKDLGMIIVDEEHDTSFKQQEGIRYNARDAAVALAYQRHIPIVLGSATPSLETWFNVVKGRYHLCRLPERTQQALPPAMRLIDLRSQPWQDGLSAVLVEAMRQQLALGNQVLLFLNRRGFAASLVCHQCAWSPHCSRCDSPLCCHTDPPKLACHHCGYESKWLYACKKCHYKLAPVGVGTQRLADTLRALFPQVPLLRIDRDSTKRKGSFDAMLADIQQGHAQILVGTQMLAKGHHFPNVTLVGILNVDSGLYSVDFRAPERLAQLIVQVAGRAGREQKPGTVYIQTLWPEHPMWAQLLQGDYEGFLNETLSKRERMALPPHRFVALLGAEATVAQRAMTFLTDISAQLSQQAIQGLSVLGPIPAFKEKRAGFYRAQLWLQSSDRRVLAQGIHYVQRYLSGHPKLARSVRCFLDIDPYQLD